MRGEKDKEDGVEEIEARRNSDGDEDFPRSHHIVGFYLDAACCERLSSFLMRHPSCEDEDWCEENQTREGEECQDGELDETVEEFSEEEELWEMVVFGLCHEELVILQA